MTQEPTDELLEEEFEYRLMLDPEEYDAEERLSRDTRTAYDRFGEVERTPHDEELEPESEL